jgi:ADP-ribose pyrophosphatase YjhB (NUDIX family)
MPEAAMPLKPKFCAQCGALLISRVLDERLREVCPACQTVFYRNPLPVAAIVMLNDSREVLLVQRRREPQQGMWCLPIGFAELDETIAEAALRELREEAGVQGRVLQMLDVDSYKSDFYGDLLIVTFEAEKIGGTEQAGDDALAVGWFPLDRLPPLAFNSNEKAIRACQDLHREEWAIRDSFLKLSTDHTQVMLSDVLVNMVIDHAEDIADLWLAEQRRSQTTRRYWDIDTTDLREKGVLALRQFGRWLRGYEAEEEIRAFYREIGALRKAEGFEPHEVFSSITLLRKSILTFAQTQDVLRRPIDAYRVLELDRRLILFFDRAMYHILRSFAEPA